MTFDGTLTTAGLLDKRVVELRKKKDKDRRIGKVRRFVFHPKEKRLIGFIVKRPDVALMFHRSDMFIAIDGFDLIDDEIHVHDDPAATGTKALKRLGVDWDSCLLWIGMNIVTESGEEIGRVGSVEFEAATGEVVTIQPDRGVTSKALLGKEIIPVSLIKGFRFGIGSQLSDYEEEDLDDDEVDEEDAAQKGELKVREDENYGAILVSDEVLDLEPEGGIAEKAGKATAVAADKGKKAVTKVKTDAEKKAKPAMDEAARKTGEAINKGAYITGKQIGKSKGMFADFMNEYRKAVNSDDEDEGK